MNRTTGRGQDWRKGVLKYTPEQLENKCNQYFSSCEEGGRKYTQPGLILFLGIAESTFNVWLNNDKGKYTEVSEVLKKAMLRMRDDLEQRGDTMSLFRLKQPCYGGYADRPCEEVGGGISVSVSFGGEEGKVAVEYGK